MTLALIVFTVILLAVSFVRINEMTETTCWERLYEASETSLQALTDAYEMDSKILSTLSEMLAAEEDVTSAQSKEYMREFSKMVPFAEFGIVYPGGHNVYSNGTMRNIANVMDFDTLVHQGDYISEFEKAAMKDGKDVIRHYVPVRNGKTVKAIVYIGLGCDDLQQVIDVDTYEGASDVYLIDRTTGQFVVDSRHSDLLSLDDYAGYRTKGDTTYEQMTEAVKAGKRGNIIIQSYEGTGYLYFHYEPTVLPNYEFVISVPEGVAFAQVERYHTIAFSLAVMEVVAFIIYLLWINRMNRRNVEKAVMDERMKKSDTAARSKSNFLSNLSHDVRTPLNAIVGFTSLARSNLDNPERVDDYLSKIASSSNHLSLLVNEVLNMSQLENGQIIMDVVPTNLPLLAKNLKRSLDAQFLAKNIEFVVKLVNVSNENVYVDKEHLSQALINLLSNAIKFTPMGGTIEFLVEQESARMDGMNSYILKIKDSGVGISDEFLAHVFDPLERDGIVDYSGSHSTGMGLTVAKSIIEFLGGTIVADSKKGEGTSITIKLSMQSITDIEDLAKAQVEEKTMKVNDLTGRRVLLVEDNDLNREIAQEILEEWGLSVSSAENGAIALNMLRYGKPKYYNLVLMDLQMPVMDGYEATTMIRNLPDKELAAIPIIAMTANAMEEDRRRVKEVGMDDFVSKPIKMAELRSAIERHIMK